MAQHYHNSNNLVHIILFVSPHSFHYIYHMDTKQYKATLIFIKLSKITSSNFLASKDMDQKLRVPVGILGNAASMLLYAAPILTFSRVIRNKSTGVFVYSVYHSSIKLFTLHLVWLAHCNGLGILLEFSFIMIYLYFASANRKKKVLMLTIPALLVFCLTAILSAFVFHDHHHRKMFVGSIGLVASVAMYGSPMVVISPNLVGSPLGILQLLLYCKYRKEGITEEPKEWDLEKNYKKQMPHLKASAEKEEEKLMHSLKVTPAKDEEKSTESFQLVVSDATNGQT